MVFRRALLYGSVFMFPPALYVYWESTRLATAYPALPIPLTSTLLTSFNPNTHRLSYRSTSTGLCTARVPRSSLEKTPFSNLHQSWAQAFLGSPRMLLEGRVFGFGKGPGDHGAGGFRPGQRLLNGVMVVETPPSDTEPLVASWTVPPRFVRFFEKLASWGYPSRLVSGGKHSFAAVVDERDKESVWVSFASVAFYERQNSETGQEDAKDLPKWVDWAHKTYARWLFDGALQALR